MEITTIQGKTFMEKLQFKYAANKKNKQKLPCFLVQSQNQIISIYNNNVQEYNK